MSLATRPCGQHVRVIFGFFPPFHERHSLVSWDLGLGKRFSLNLKQFSQDYNIMNQLQENSTFSQSITMQQLLQEIWKQDHMLSGIPSKCRMNGIINYVLMGCSIWRSPMVYDQIIFSVLVFCKFYLLPDPITKVFEHLSWIHISCHEKEIFDGFCPKRKWYVSIKQQCSSPTLMRVGFCNVPF